MEEGNNLKVSAVFSIAWKKDHPADRWQSVAGMSVIRHDHGAVSQGRHGRRKAGQSRQDLPSPLYKLSPHNFIEAPFFPHNLFFC
jgi:hypothetical protein